MPADEIGIIIGDLYVQTTWKCTAMKRINHRNKKIIGWNAFGHGNTGTRRSAAIINISVRLML